MMVPTTLGSSDMHRDSLALLPLPLLLQLLLPQPPLDMRCSSVLLLAMEPMPGTTPPLCSPFLVS
jgi:hypothetical protein